MQISRFQTSGSDPGGDFGMQNSILRSTNCNSFDQGRKIRKQKLKQVQNYIIIKSPKSFNQGRLFNSSCVCFDDLLENVGTC